MNIDRFLYPAAVVVAERINNSDVWQSMMLKAQE